MKNKVSKAIVIDASIARSAGETQHPTSRMCREFLEAVLLICHRMAANPEILAEWDRHQSRFSRRWRLAMVRKGKFVALPRGTDKELWAAFGDSELSATNYSNLHKDLHLIEAALRADRRVASLDDAVRDIFRQCTGTVAKIGDIA